MSEQSWPFASKKKTGIWGTLQGSWHDSVGLGMQEGEQPRTWEEFSKEPRSARSQAQQRRDEYREAFHWGVPLGPLQVVVSILYGLLGVPLVWLGMRDALLYMEVIASLPQISYTLAIHARERQCSIWMWLFPPRDCLTSGL